MRALEIDPSSQILATTQASGGGQITCQTGYGPTGEVQDDRAPLWGQVGFDSRPADPTPDGRAAECISLTNDDEPQVIATRDPRKPPPHLAPGEVCVRAMGLDASAGGYWTGSGITMSVKYDNTGYDISLKIIKDGSVIISSQNAEVALRPNEVTVTAGSNTVTVDTTGIKLGGSSDFVALASKVDAELAKIAATLPTGANGGGTVAYANPYIPSSVGSATVRSA